MDTITLVSPRYPPYLGGVETHVSELARRIRGRFRKVSVVTTDPGGQLPRAQSVESGVEVYRVKSFAPNENYHLPCVPSFVRQLKECHSQILHLHGVQDVPGPVASLFGGGSAVVLTPHFSGQIQSTLGKLLFAGYRPLLRHLVERVAFVICVSGFEAGRMRKVLPESAGKIRVIPNGVDFGLMSTHKWCLPDKPTILYAGRLEKHKNVDKIICALQNLRRTYPTLKLTVVGRGPMKEQLHGLATSLGVETHVNWIDGASREELYMLYSSSTVVVLPSDIECFGLVAAEAISLGAPTVVTDCSALSEFIENGLAQPVEPPVNAQKLEVTLSKVLENPHAFSPKYESGGPIVSWEEVAERTCALYESAVKGESDR